MKKFFVFLFCLIAISSLAQDTVAYDGPMVIVHKDSRLDALVKKQATITTATKKAAGRTMPGYRLLVINTNSRDEALAAKAKIYTHFPDQKAYLVYQEPFFKIKAGNYQTREDAKRYQELMNALFPKGVFIIHDTIEVKPEKEKEDENSLPR